MLGLRRFGLLVMISVCTACNSQTTNEIALKTRISSAEGSPEEAPVSFSKTGVVRLKPFVVHDEQLGIEALRFLMPADWSVEGGVIWRANPSRPATVSIRIYNPHGVEEIGAVPDIPCIWAATLPAFGFPQGSYYLGNEVHPPISDATAALRILVLPRYSAHLPGASITSQELLPEMAQAVAAANYPELQGIAKFSGGKIRIEYKYESKPVEMDIYGVVGMWTTPIQGVPMTFWGIDGIRYSRADKGKLEEQFKLFQTVLYSERLNIEWLNLYSQIQKIMVNSQIEASNRAVELSRYLSQTSREISDNIRRSYEQRQAATDRAAARFDRYIRGVDAYRSPFEDRLVELPSGYRNVWANSSGEYILSNNPNLNPNVGGTQQWRSVNPQP
ncbi:MAG: hypothetical protein JO159_12120 [Acidobacteria bacterium]|nr:hypothetical protein [Acidobacteriota bacterium]